MSTTIAFDCDGTLIDYNDNVRWEIVDILRNLCGVAGIIVWSGGGEDYARHVVRKLNLEPFVSQCRCKPAPKEVDKKEIDICFDDEFVDLAKVNIKI